jgi:Zn-dependent protease with chaperone function
MAKIDAYYPPSPRNVPADLTALTAQYKHRVVLVLMSLILFFFLYLGLLLGSGVVCVLSLLVFGPVGILFAVPAGFFFLFLLKGFFKRGEKEKEMMLEITEQEQPLLFAFIERLCEETGAPFPYKIFVSPEVNAAVFYNTSVLSLFWPTPKNLLIGLGLVNVLNLTEFKSVLAHEFGHFSQNSMKVQSYVYVANRVIGDMVYGRDWFDSMLLGWTRLDVRIAWVGWVLLGIIWMLRKVLEGFFYLINLLRFSLSREMEFNADLVAVSVAGSDAGVHALYRIGFAEETWGQTISDLKAALDHKLYTADLFYHLNHAANFLRKQKKEPRRGEPPPLPADPRDTKDLFKPEDEAAPQMWASHPSNFDREQNAKEYYIRSAIDERSAWVLFQDPPRLREDVTYRFYRVGAGLKKEELELADPEEVQAFINDEHAETTYDPRYHGLYDDRYLEIDDVRELVDEAVAARWNEGRLERVHLKLYDDELKQWMEGYKGRREEHRLLSGLASGELELKGQDLEFRGRKYDPHDAKRLLKKVDKELEEDREYFEALDRRAFLVSYQMARHAGDELGEEMVARYEFHVTCQRMLRKLSAERAHMDAALAFLQGKRQLQRHEFKAALKAFRDAHRALAKALHTADDLPLPALKNMKKGKPLGTFLLDKRLVYSLDRDEGMLRGDWINKFLSQLTEVLEKLRRIHFKSLGGILLLQDRIHQEWKQQLAALPLAQPLTEGAAAPPVTTPVKPAAPPTPPPKRASELPDTSPKR